MIQRIGLFLAGVAATIIVLAILRHSSLPATIPVPARVPTPPRLHRLLGAALDANPPRRDSIYRRDFLTTFSSLTVESSMQWDVIERQRGKFDFGDADAVVGFAGLTGRRVRGHPLVWGQQLPSWLTDRAWTPADLTQVMRTYIDTVVGHYRDSVDNWDVVNEPLNGDGGLSHNMFLRTLGPRYIDLAFRLAHAANPSARLFLNEIGAESPGPKQKGLLRLVRRLKARGVPIDGVGFENHTDAGDYPPRRTLQATLRRFAELGVAVEITEMDVALNRGRHVADPLAAQADGYTAAGAACAATPRCTGVTVWGVTDRWSWLGEAARALPFDSGGRPKPALGALLRSLGG